MTSGERKPGCRGARKQRSPHPAQRKVPLKTTKPGWFARLFVCGTGSLGRVSIAYQDVKNL